MTEPSPTGDPTPAEKPANAIPEELREFGHFKLERELGRGAQGVVYLAEDTRLRRRVALKVLTGSAAQSAEVRARFRREGEIASKLDHPGICGIHEVGEVRGVPFISMQFLRGSTLAGLIQQARSKDGSKTGDKRVDPSNVTTSLVGKDAMQDVLRLIERAARALHAAHEVGLVHRDIKPGNLMITPDGQPVLLDFGLARDIEDQSEALTETGQIMGTPAYMAAEQLRGQRDQVDRRTDVYALGVILYESLTLRLPFDATSFELLFNQILQGTPPNPRRFNPRIPPDLRTVIEVAMERDRARRYASALDLAEDLRRVRTFEPIQARAAGPVLRARKWARREPAKAVAILALAMFVLSGVGFLVNQRLTRLRTAREHLDRAEVQLEARDFTGALEAVAQSRESQPNSTRALEIKARIESARQQAARDAQKAADLQAAAAARAESAQQEGEYATQRADIVALQQTLLMKRAKVFGEYASGEARTAFAREEHELEQKRIVAEQLLQDSQESLERAARLESAWGRSPETEEAFASFYLARWGEAVDAGDSARSVLFRSLVEQHDPGRVHERELLGHGELSLTVEPSEAEIYLFRYESYETVRPGDPLPRLVPVPTSGIGRARAGAWVSDFYVGDKCLWITSVEPGSAAETAGLRSGDLVVRLNGQPVGDGLFVTSATVGIEPPARVASLNGTAIAGPFDWSTAPPRKDGRPDRVRMAGREDDLHCDRGELVLEEAEDLVAKGCPGAPFKILCLHDGEPVELEVSSSSGSGIRCERTAYPLICSSANRIDAHGAIETDPGSYLLLVRAAGHEDQRVPLVIPRLGRTERHVVLLRVGTTPPGFVYIAPGPFTFGGDPKAVESAPAQLVDLPGFFLGRREVTNAEWAEFVDDPETQKRIQASSKPLYVPREKSSTPIPEKNRGGPTTPVIGISWNEIRDYLAWRNQRAQAAGAPVRFDLPTEEEWEKGARGVDARAFPWGNRFDFDLVVGLYSKPTALFSAPGGFEPSDESPFGVQDAGGLRQEWTSTPFPADRTAPPLYQLCGGCWIATNDSFFRSASRFGQDASVGGGPMGFRLVARPANDR